MLTHHLVSKRSGVRSGQILQSFPPKTSLTNHTLTVMMMMIYQMMSSRIRIRIRIWIKNCSKNPFSHSLTLPSASLLLISLISNPVFQVSIPRSDDQEPDQDPDSFIPSPSPSDWTDPGVELWILLFE